VEKSIYSVEYQRLCSLLRELRHEAALTQVQVAVRLGVSLGVSLRDVLDRLGQEPGGHDRA
jgi:transcriptional regulator with XRE-family HTH domain